MFKNTISNLRLQTAFCCPISSVSFYPKYSLYICLTWQVNFFDKTTPSYIPQLRMISSLVIKFPFRSCGGNTASWLACMTFHVIASGDTCCQLAHRPACWSSNLHCKGPRRALLVPGACRASVTDLPPCSVPSVASASTGDFHLNQFLQRWLQVSDFLLLSFLLHLLAGILVQRTSFSYLLFGISLWTQRFFKI